MYTAGIVTMITVKTVAITVILPHLFLWQEHITSDLPSQMLCQDM